MARDLIEYERLIDEAMRLIVKKTLEIVESSRELPGEHHFFITFFTTHPGVMMPDTLRAKYPKEMTIVLQHQFWDLEVGEEHFSITLSFDNVHHNLTVPYSALMGFADPSVRFGLQFRRMDSSEGGENEEDRRSSKRRTPDLSPEQMPIDASNVVSIDSFRKG